MMIPRMGGPRFGMKLDIQPPELDWRTPEGKAAMKLAREKSDGPLRGAHMTDVALHLSIGLLINPKFQDLVDEIPDEAATFYVRASGTEPSPEPGAGTFVYAVRPPGSDLNQWNPSSYGVMGDSAREMYLHPMSGSPQQHPLTDEILGFIRQYYEDFKKGEHLKAFMPGGVFHGGFPLLNSAGGASPEETTVEASSPQS